MVINGPCFKMPEIAAFNFCRHFLGKKKVKASHPNRPIGPGLVVAWTTLHSRRPGPARHDRSMGRPWIPWIPPTRSSRDGLGGGLRADRLGPCQDILQKATWNWEKLGRSQDSQVEEYIYHTLNCINPLSNEQIVRIQGITIVEYHQS